MEDFWEDRYHATAVEDGEHFFRCCAYIDLNMVRAGVVDHPSQWPHSGYNEVQRPRRKNVLIDYERFMELLGTDDYDQVKRDHQGWAGELLRNRSGPDDKWTRSIAVGNKEFVDNVKSRLGVLAKGRDTVETAEGWQLREPTEAYMPHFEAGKGDIGPENTCFWHING